MAMMACCKGARAGERGETVSRARAQSTYDASCALKSLATSGTRDSSACRHVRDAVLEPCVARDQRASAVPLAVSPSPRCPAAHASTTGCSPSYTREEADPTSPSWRTSFVRLQHTLVISCALNWPETLPTLSTSPLRFWVVSLSLTWARSTFDSSWVVRSSVTCPSLSSRACKRSGGGAYCILDNPHNTFDMHCDVMLPATARAFSESTLRVEGCGRCRTTANPQSMLETA
mmetsp:Transcript_18138/g.36589  ORF Transcript_18138/g.36589 Transcript_18138/m.36589 type:complete len:232 (+) Transcript_18138:1465-2160(+)